MGIVGNLADGPGRRLELDVAPEDHAPPEADIAADDQLPAAGQRRRPAGEAQFHAGRGRLLVFHEQDEIFAAGNGPDLELGLDAVDDQ